MRWRLLLVLTGSILMAIMGNLIAIFHAVIGSTDRAWRVAISNDQTLNAALGGSEDETLSSHAARARSEGRLWGCVLCRLLDKFQPNHCTNSQGV